MSYQAPAKQLLSIILLAVVLVNCSKLASSDHQFSIATITLTTVTGEMLSDSIVVRKIADSLNYYVSETYYPEGNTSITLSSNLFKPQYISVTYGDFEDKIYLTPGSAIGVTIGEDNKVDSFSGDLINENSYLQDIKNNEELRRVGWSTSEESNLDTLKKKLDIYFEVKEQILRDFISDEENPFYKLRLVEQRAFRDYALLNFIENQYERSDLATHNLLNKEILAKEYITFTNATENFESDYYRFLVGKYVLEYYFEQDYGTFWRDSVSVVGYSNMVLSTVHSHFPPDMENWYNYERLYYLILDNSNADRAQLVNTQRLVHQYGQYLSNTNYTKIQDIFNDQVKTFSKIAPGELVPVFDLLTDKGEPFELRSNGKAVLYDIWASWCAPCFTGFPRVKKIESDYADRLDVVSLSFDEDKLVHKNTLERFDIPGNVHLIDTNAFNGEFAKHFNIYAIPAYLLVDANNQIIAFGSLDVVEQKIAEL